jgi:CBS domain containing-hemolysin-like protein
MTPRSDIFFLPLSLGLPETLNELNRTRHTKVPIFKEHRDNIVGILYARDLLRVDLEKIAKEPQGFQQLLREPYFVPESKPASELFDTFRDRRMSIALAVDEYGGAEGLVTAEDIMEEVVEEMEDEYDEDEKSQQWVQKINESDYIVSARIEIENFEEELDIVIPKGKYETLAGYLLEVSREIPAVGATVEVDGIKYTIKKGTPQTIQEIRVHW